MKDYYKIVKKHYDQEAIKHNFTSLSTMPDKNVRILEIHNILKYIDEDSRCLEVGCGNGWASVEISKSKKINLTSMEINDKMLKISLKQPKNKIKGDLEFIHKDILRYSKKDHYDTIFSIRCIVNIMEWALQKKALQNMCKSIKSGGKLILLEAFSDGLENLNEARKELGLEPIKPASHNLHLNKKKVISQLKNWGLELVNEDNFLSSYYFWTRVIYPSIAASNNLQLIFNSKIDGFFSYFPPYGNFAHIKILVFHKK